MRIGILALQGGYNAHAMAVRDLGHSALEIREELQLPHIDGLILPGGESTAQLKLIDRFGLDSPLNEFVQSKKPVLSTCAGLILCAKEVVGPSQRSFGWLDVCVHRNAWGRQLDSFEGYADNEDLPLCFIRAPRITSVGLKTKVLATLNNEAIFVQEENVFGTTFHPELTSDRRVHQMVFGTA